MAGTQNLGSTGLQLRDVTFSPTTGGIIGTNTNDAATAGVVGQYVESVVSAVTYPATTAYGDAASISLTAGDWDVSYNLLTESTAAVQQLIYMGISTTPGNSNAGLVLGSNFYAGQQLAAGNEIGQTIAVYRISLNATTTVYAKFRADYTTTAPRAYARLSARRVR